MTNPPMPPMPGDPPPDSKGHDSAAPEEAQGGTLPAWARRRTPTRELSDDKLAVFIGPRWESSYRRKLTPFLDDPAFVPTWNWAAALFGTLWFVYRKLYLAFALFLLAQILAFPLLTGSNVQLTGTSALDPENRWLLGMTFAVNISVMLAAGGTANWFLFRRARAAIRLVTLQGVPEPESVRLLARIGGVNWGGVLFMLAIFLMSTLAAARA